VPDAVGTAPVDERRATSQTQVLARHALDEAAYDAAAGRGAAMDDDEVVRYAVGEFQRVAALLAQPGAQAPHAPPSPASGPQATVTVPPRPA
jgi:hypothetical protein